MPIVHAMTQAAKLPQIAVGAIVEKDGHVLLVLRGKEPNAGEWAIPGGRLHWGESLQEAAEREILEETGISIRAGGLCYHFEYLDRDAGGEPRFHYVILDLVGTYLHGDVQAGDDALDARWVGLEELNTLNINPTTLDALQQCFPLQFTGGEQR